MRAPQAPCRIDTMLRLTQIKTSLDHTDDDIKSAILKRLEIAADQLIRYTVFRRGYDARKRSAIHFIFTIDVELKDEAGVLRRLKAKGDDANLGPTPDTRYRFVAQAPSNLTRRPVIRNRGTISSISPLPATPHIVARPHASRADSTAWRMTETRPVASNVKSAP